MFITDHYFSLGHWFRAEEQQKAKPSNDLLDLDFGNPTAKSSVPEKDLKNALEQPPPPPRTIGASIDPWGMTSDTASPALKDATGVSTKSDPWRATTSSSTATYNDEVSAAVPTCPTTMSKSKDPWCPVSSVCTSSTETATASINLKSGTSNSCKLFHVSQGYSNYCSFVNGYYVTLIEYHFVQVSICYIRLIRFFIHAICFIRDVGFWRLSLFACIPDAL